MIIPITKKYQILIFSIGLPLLISISAAFRYAPSPPIRSKEFKKFKIVSNQPVLLKHTKIKYNIHGNIIEYAEFKPNKKNTSVQKLLKILKYNAEGLLIGTMSYNENNALIFSRENKYNSINQLVKISKIDYVDNTNNIYLLLDYNSDDKLVLKQKFDYQNKQLSQQNKNYNSEGELIYMQDWFYTQEQKKALKKVITVEYQYNEKGQIIASTLYEQIGNTKTREIRLFENNALVSWIKLKNGKLVSHFKHGQKQNMIQEEQDLIPPPILDPNKMEMEYDDSKRDPLQNIPHTTFRTISIKSDKKGLASKKVTREYNEIIEVIYYSYNDKKQLIKERFFDKKKYESKEIIYSYDIHQNITENTVYHNDSLIQKTNYKYEYY